MSNYLYKLQNTVTDKCYVGFTTTTPAKRFKKHCSNAKGGRKSKLYSSMRKHGFDAFTVTEIYFGEDALEQEQNFIISEKAEYNMTPGGEANQLGRTWKWTEEQKQKMKGIPKPPRTKEHSAAIAEGRKGIEPWNKGIAESTKPHAVYMRAYNKKKRAEK
jgi:group I intron endonuclease